MQIYRQQDATTIEKASGTQITYHLFDEYEINMNVIPPHSSQDWHYHKKKEEVVVVIEGAIDVEWRDNGRNGISRVEKGDLVRLESTPHRFVNSYDRPCQFICFKLVITGKSQRDILAGDKYSI